MSMFLVVVAGAGLLVALFAPELGRLGAGMFVGGLGLLAMIEIVRSPKASIVCAFLSIAPCVMMPLFVLVLFPFVLFFGAVAVWHWSQGAYSSQS